ncbi:MAG: efflux RND transporter periplasmic adaptor subunit [candidate division Zixibacteria bacterium]|nr:efflux RND transporter periplasmic adaptor subunit [candidate division Zixibacteria bacterium]
MKILTYTSMLLMIVVSLAFAGCGDDDRAREQTSAAPNEHGEEGRASAAVTLWTDKMELFMEYEAFTVNEPGRFIIHLTILDGFQPVREGSVKLTFVAEDGHTHNIVATELLREGIFTPTVELDDPGRYKFALVYNGSVVRDSFSIDGFTVYQSPGQIPHTELVESGEEIGFLKEQQWKIPFATTEVETREIKRSVWAIGEVLPSPSAYVEIVSPVDGVVSVGESGQLALPGSIVKRNDVLVTITPPVQGNGWASSQLAYKQAKRDFERVQRLKERQAISEREFERIRDEYLAMKAGFEALSGGGDSGALTLKAPISGKIIEWQVRPGQRVGAGDKLMAIVDPSTVWLQVNVYENDFRTRGRPVGVYVKSGGATGGWEISESDMKVLTTGGALDPTTSTIPVLLEVSNSENRLRINESTPVELYTSEGANATAVPKSSVYEDEGMDVVFVQTAGESFEKRVVTVGPHYRGWIAILKGLDPGQRVVTKGGYHVKLVSTSASTGSGHAH